MSANNFISEDTRTYGLPPDVPPEAAAAFALVATLPEVCHRWDKSRKTVLLHLWKGTFPAIQQGRTWLIFVPAVAAKWGAPKRSIE